MTLRVSTNGLFSQNLATLQQRQVEIARLQQQISSGVKLTLAGDDPGGMAQSQQLDHVLARLAQYDRNANLVGNRLTQQESALSDAGDALARARELATQANNDALSDTDRHAIAVELRSLRANLLQVANRDDGTGRRLFAGTRDGVVPFTDNAGTVSYSGDDGQNQVDVAADVAVADANAGSEVFLRMSTGDGISRGFAGAGNTGSGVLDTAQVTDPAAWNGATLTLRFTSASTYAVVDGSGNPLSPPVTGSWTAGQTITAQGVQFRVTGAPATGDTFTVSKAPNQDVFASLQQLADALDAPESNATDVARRANALRDGMKSLDMAQQHLLDIRADTGIRRAALDNAADRRGADNESFTKTLSDLRDTDLTDAIGKLNLKMVALDAAQQLMVKLGASLLFNKL